MKKLISLILILTISKFSLGQLYNTPYQSLGSINVAVRDTGAFFVRQTFVPPVYSDTSAANLAGYPKNYGGSVIITSTDKKMWMRNFTVNQWIAIGSSSPQGIQSVLDYDNVLTRNDSIRARSSDFTIDSVGNFKVNALSGVVLGFNSTAGGSNATALGVLNTASGSRAIVIGGVSNTASGLASIAGGANTTAGNTYSVGLGHGSNSNGIASYAFGEYSNASGNASFILGSKDTVSVDSSGAVGVGLSNTVSNTLKLGYRDGSNISIVKGTNYYNSDPTKVLSTDANGNLVLVTSGTGGSPTWQNTLDNGSVLNKDNSVNGGGFNLSFLSNANLNIESTGDYKIGDYNNINLGSYYAFNNQGHKFYTNGGENLVLADGSGDVSFRNPANDERTLSVSSNGVLELRDGISSNILFTIDNTGLVFLNTYPDTITTNYSVLGRDIVTGKIGVIAGGGGSPTLQDVYDNGNVANKDNTFDLAGFNHTYDNVGNFLVRSNLGIDLINATSNGDITFNGITDITGAPTLAIGNTGALISRSTSSDQNIYLPRFHTGSGNDISNFSIDSANLFLNHYPDTLTTNYSLLGRDIVTGKIGVIASGGGSPIDTFQIATHWYVDSSVSSGLSGWGIDNVLGVAQGFTDNRRIGIGDYNLNIDGNSGSTFQADAGHIIFNSKNFVLNDNSLATVLPATENAYFQAYATTPSRGDVYILNPQVGGVITGWIGNDTTDEKTVLQLSTNLDGGNVFYNVGNTRSGNSVWEFYDKDHNEVANFYGSDKHAEFWGNVGIGTSTPIAALHIKTTGGNINTLFDMPDNTATGVYIGNVVNADDAGLFDRGADYQIASYNQTTSDFTYGGGGIVYNKNNEIAQVSGKLSLNNSSPTEFFTVGAGNIKIDAGGLILPTYAALDLSGGDYTATTAGYYEITTGSLTNAFILPDPTTLNGQQITVVNASGTITPVIGGSLITSLSIASVTIYTAVGGNWYGK